MKLNLNKIELITTGLASQFPRDRLTQVAFSGRSNVGKSSLVNCLLNRSSLARVSSSPGKTITINFYRVDSKLYIVDLPGYGYAKRSAEEQKKWSSLVDGYISGERKPDLIVQLIDMKVGPTTDDNMMLGWLKTTGIPFIIVATKSDKLNRTQYAAMLSAIGSHPSIPEGTPVIPFSSQTKEGRNAIWEAIDRMCSGSGSC